MRRLASGMVTGIMERSERGVPIRFMTTVSPLSSLDCRISSSLPLIASPHADVALLRTDSDFQAQLKATTTLLRKRIIACLDVRMNDAGDVVVTKGDQYDVRERDGANAVRNLGAPVALAERYYNEGADGTSNIFPIVVAYC